MPDGVKLSSLCFFTVDVSFKLIILSCEAIFSWLSIYLSKPYCTEGCSSGRGVAWWGSVPAKKPAGSWGLFFPNPALMCCSNSAKDAYIIPLNFLEMNLQHITSSCESEILSEMGKQEKAARREESSCMIFYS